MPILILATVMVLLVPAPSEAQQPVFVPSASSLRVGTEVYVVVDAPCTPAGCGGVWVRGRVTDLTAASLTIDDGRSRHQLAAADIRLVSRRGDRIWNGVGNGAVMGFVAGFFPALIDNHDDCKRGCFIPPAMVGVLVGTIGAGIGAALGGIVDARIKGDRTVWERRPEASRRTSVVPLVGHRAAGFQVRVRF